MFAALNLNDIYLSGVSGGGYLCLKACVHAPERINRAFLMVPGGLVDLSSINLKFILSAIPAILGFEWGGRFFVRRLLSPHFKDEATIHEMGAGMQNMLSGLKPQNGPKPLSDAELNRITCPIYIVVAEFDIAVNSTETLQRAQKQLKHVTTRLIDAGHMVTIEKRDWLMDAMFKFFEVE